MEADKASPLILKSQHPNRETPNRDTPIVKLRHPDVDDLYRLPYKVGGVNHKNQKQK